MLQLPENVKTYVLLTVLLCLVVGLFIKKVKPSYLFGGSVVLLMALGIIEVDVFLESLSNKSVLIIFLLIFITTALKDNFNLIYYIDKFFSRIKSPRLFILSMTSTVALLSSVVNNTPVVALMIPYVQKWGKENGYAPSKFLIPLAYSATLGGMITLIGTSTNLILNGLLTSNGYEGFQFFDFMVLGLILTAVGVVYFTTIGYNLLPVRQDALESLIQNPREYILETKIIKGAPIINKTVAQAGLRNLKRVYLAEVVREGELISPVSPDLVLKENDLLYFTGETENVMELVKDNKFGIVVHKANKYKLSDHSEILEVLISITSDLASKKVRETDFRERYDGAIVAIHRNGEKIGGKIGDVTLRYGDLLLVASGKDFMKNVKEDKNLYIISTVTTFENENHKRNKTWFIALSLLFFIGLFSGLWSVFMTLILILSSLFILKLFTFNDLKNQLNLDLLLVLVSSLTLGSGILNSGVAILISDTIFSSIESVDPFISLVVIFGITVVLTSFVTNIAAVSIVFPIAAAYIESSGVPARPIFLAIAFAASAAFLTPVSYQTNLMVFGPGGYNSKDFLKSGLVLTVLYCLICTAYLYMQID